MLPDAPASPDEDMTSYSRRHPATSDRQQLANRTAIRRTLYVKTAPLTVSQERRDWGDVRGAQTKGRRRQTAHGQTFSARAARSDYLTARAWMGIVNARASGCGPNSVDRPTLCKHCPNAVEASSPGRTEAEVTWPAVSTWKRIPIWGLPSRPSACVKKQS